MDASDATPALNLGWRENFPDHYLTLEAMDSERQGSQVPSECVENVAESLSVKYRLFKRRKCGGVRRGLPREIDERNYRSARHGETQCSYSQ